MWVSLLRYLTPSVLIKGVALLSLFYTTIYTIDYLKVKRKEREERKYQRKNFEDRLEMETIESLKYLSKKKENE